MPVLNSIFNQHFAQLPARGRSFAGDENGYAVSGGEARRSEAPANHASGMI
jgi:hypothetical protein